MAQKSNLIQNITLRYYNKFCLFGPSISIGEDFIRRQIRARNKDLPEDLHWHSQIGQDFFVWELFCLLDRGEIGISAEMGGVFLDVGANNPVIHNNTCALEKRGWTGLAIEPQAEFQQVWKEKRKTLLLPYAVGSEDGLDIDFWRVFRVSSPEWQILTGRERKVILSQSDSVRLQVFCRSMA